MLNHTLATVILDPPTALLFGCVVALASYRLIRAAPDAEVSRVAKIGAAWGAFYAVCVGWMYFNRPDWMLVYLADAKNTPLVPTYVLFMALCALFGVFGAVATGSAIARGKMGLAWLFAIGALLTIAATMLLQLKQYMAVGTLEEYAAGRALPLQEDKTLQFWMNIAGAFSTLSALGAIGFRFIRGRKVTSAAPAP